MSKQDFMGVRNWIDVQRALLGLKQNISYSSKTLLKVNNDPIFFFLSLAVSAITMIVLYSNAVIKSNVSIVWWYFWLLCLAIAISLQLTMVFELIRF